MKRARPSALAFTLLELLIVVAIIAILFSLVGGGLKAARRAAGMAREINAARQLMGAYVAYAGSNDGQLLPGYGDFPAKDEQGSPLAAPVSSRYPWRLAPYFNYEMKLLWGNIEGDQLSKLASGDRSSYLYRVSVEPSLGLNAVYVGGDYSTVDPTSPKALSRYGQFCVTRMSQATHPSRLIVFASGGGSGGSYAPGSLTGYFKVSAPNFTGRTWATTWNPTLSADSFGNVDFRFDEKAIVAMLDGHVELLGFNELNDMRRWSNLAADLDDPNWKLGKQ